MFICLDKSQNHANFYIIAVTLWLWCFNTDLIVWIVCIKSPSWWTATNTKDTGWLRYSVWWVHTPVISIFISITPIGSIGIWWFCYGSSIIPSWSCTNISISNIPFFAMAWITYIKIFQKEYPPITKSSSILHQKLYLFMSSLILWLPSTNGSSMHSAFSVQS